jgi:hypothetical protein
LKSQYPLGDFYKKLLISGLELIFFLGQGRGKSKLYCGVRPLRRIVGACPEVLTGSGLMVNGGLLDYGQVLFLF